MTVTEASPVRGTLVHALLKEGRGRIAASWTQGTFQIGGACGFGALLIGGAAHTLAIEAATELVKHIPDDQRPDLSFPAAGSMADVMWYVARWNDAPGRTQADVLEVYDAAILATAP